LLLWLNVRGMLFGGNAVEAWFEEQAGSYRFPLAAKCVC
jgi:hypothetical protein